MDDFMIRAALAGIGVALGATFPGVFVVWRRMAYFGDATAHAALLGVAFSLLFGVSLWAGVGLIAALAAITVAHISGKDLPVDAALGVIAHGGLAFGLLGLSLMPQAAVNAQTYLFGDILAVTPADLRIIWIGAMVIIAVFAALWPKLILASLSPEMACAEDINPKLMRFVLAFTIAAIVAISLKIVGALLITAMLILPPAAARPLSKSPEAMVIWTGIIGIASAIGGVYFSWNYDTATGPSIVCVATIIFAFTHIIAAIWRR